MTDNQAWFFILFFTVFGVMVGLTIGAIVPAVILLAMTGFFIGVVFTSVVRTEQEKRKRDDD